jgi:hypothetical protein
VFAVHGTIRSLAATGQQTLTESCQSQPTASDDRRTARTFKVVFPAVAGGEVTLRDLVREFKTTGSTYRRTVQTTLRASYTNHYRRGIAASARLPVSPSGSPSPW